MVLMEISAKERSYVKEEIFLCFMFIIRSESGSVGISAVRLTLWL